MTTRRVIAILLIAAVAILPWIWHPWTDDDDKGSAPVIMSTAYTAAKVPFSHGNKRACPRDDPCLTARKVARKFRHDKIGHSSRMLPLKVRKALNSKYKGAVNDWWNKPCANTGWVCGGKYCQAMKSFGTTQRCLDPGWYKGRHVPFRNRVIIVCGGLGILGFFGGRTDPDKPIRAGWFGAGVGAGSCLYQALNDKNNWGWP